MGGRVSWGGPTGSLRRAFTNFRKFPKIRDFVSRERAPLIKDEQSRRAARIPLADGARVMRADQKIAVLGPARVLQKRNGPSVQPQSSRRIRCRKRVSPNAVKKGF